MTIKVITDITTESIDQEKSDSEIAILQMNEKIVLDIIKNFNDALNLVWSFAEESPDDPIIENDQNDISIEELDKVQSKKVTFTCADGLSYTLWLSQAFLDDFRKARAFPVDRNGNLMAESITIWKGFGDYSGGLTINGNSRWFCYTPEFWSHVKTALPDGFKLTGEDAYRFWLTLKSIVNSWEAEVHAIAIKRNPNLLSLIQIEKPYLFDHPVIQAELVKAFRNNQINQSPAKKGRPIELTEKKLEMYHWVYFYRFQGMSLEDACEKTINKHPKLVPDNWSDTNKTLQKHVTRLDKIPSISQRKGFLLKKDKK